MKRRAKLEDIVWIAERGERYVIPERRHDWLMLCLKNASSKNAAQEMAEFLNIVRMDSEGNSASEIDQFIDLKKYKYLGGEWLAIQSARFLQNGEAFVKDLVEKFGVKLTDSSKKLIEEALEENKQFSSQQNKNKR